MNASTALVRVPKGAAAPVGLVALRRRMIERALDDAAVRPRVWLEALEARRMMSAAGAMAVTALPNVGDQGRFSVPFNGYYNTGWPEVRRTPDGGYLVAGTVEAQGDDPNWPPTYWGFAKFTADGKVDPRFGPDGSGVEVFKGNLNSWADMTFVQPDGKIVVVGEQPWSALIVGRLNADGSADATFNGGQPVSIGGYPSPAPMPITLIGWSSWVTPDGKVQLAWTEGSQLVTMRLNADGTPDASLAPGGWVAGDIDSEGTFGFADGNSILEDAEPLAGGGFAAYVAPFYKTGGPMERIAVGDDGQVRSTAVVDTSASGQSGMYDVVAMPDGSAFVSPNYQGAPTVIEKVDAAGQPVTSWGNGGVVSFGGNGPWTMITAAPSGELYVDYLPGTVRLAADGSVDASFNQGLPAPVWPIGALFLPDGSLISANVGTFEPYGVPSFELVKVEADGSLPPIFSDGSDGTDGTDGTKNQGGGDTASPVEGDPAAFAATRRVPDFGGGGAGGLFDPAAGATLFDPDGTSVLN